MKERLSSLGSVGTAFLSSICWLGVPVFASLGLSGVGVSLAGSLSGYRTYFLVVTIILLGSAHYLLYKKSNRNYWNRVIVWGATVLVVAQLAYSLVNTLLLSSPT